MSAKAAQFTSAEAIQVGESISSQRMQLRGGTCPTQCQLNAAQVSKGSFNASSMQHNSAKAAQLQVGESNSSRGKRFNSANEASCSFKATHACSTPA
jgi:hypothetical protein